MTPIKVAIAGASGETGTSIVNGLLRSSTHKFDIIALTRAASVDKPVNQALKDKGVKIVIADLQGPQDELVKILSGTDVVISTLLPMSNVESNNLASAAKVAGVGRFVPSSFATPAPRGVLAFRDLKEDTFDHIKRLHLPYTIIDVGWWYQLSLPKLPSGRTDYALPFDELSDYRTTGTGNVPSAHSDLRDIGTWVARIITDARTLNRQVLCFGEVLTQNEIIALAERISGETIPRGYVKEDEILKTIRDAQEAIDKNPHDFKALYTRSNFQYRLSWGIRGDNTPEIATYFGYLLAPALYPDIQPTRFEDYLGDVIKGQAPTVYETSAWVARLRETTKN